MAGDLNPCLHCGRIPGGSRVGAMVMYRCGVVRPRCGRYVYGETAEIAARRWNESNPLPSETPRESNGGGG